MSKLMEKIAKIVSTHDAKKMAKNNDGKATPKEIQKFKKNMKDMKDDGKLNKSN